jgi:N-acetylmuramoyl-L-alanine amidase
MSTEYTVQSGDCLNSIGVRHGFTWQTLWNFSDNAELKSKRKDPNILYPGDVVMIRDESGKQESCATEATHKFKKKGVPAKLLVKIIRFGEPVKNVKYELEIDGKNLNGTTTSEGQIEHGILPDAQLGLLRLEDGEQLILELGALDPVTEVSGV